MMFVCLWSGTWRGGFAWDGSFLQFNWHPVLMVAGLVVLYGNGEVSIHQRKNGTNENCMTPTSKHLFPLKVVFKKHLSISVHAERNTGQVGYFLIFDW